MDKKALAALLTILVMMSAQPFISASEFEKTVMYVTHVTPWPSPIFDVTWGHPVDIWKCNYMFLNFPIWGDYFVYESSDEEINDRIAAYKAIGLHTVLYVDVTESHVNISDRWSDSIIESGDWWSLMSLDPSKSWYGYLKEGMLNMTERFPKMKGFAIDRLDRCYNGQEEIWAAQLLDEVKDEAELNVRYVMNSLQPWMTDLASRAAFIGSDGVNTEQPYLNQTIGEYEYLASFAEFDEFYINPHMGLPEEELIEAFEAILEVHDFIFMDDYYLHLLDILFPT